MTNEERDERSLSIRQMMLPKDTNGQGTIFGGVILAQIDLAGAEAARNYRAHRYATVAMKEVEFHAPVQVGDVVSFYSKVVKVGRTSITIHVDVEARRVFPNEEVVKVTEADVIFVALDSLGRPTTVDA